MLIFLLCIQIIAESLPISSSGHVALAQDFLRKQGYEVIIPQHVLWLVHGITALLMLLIMMPYWVPLLRHPWRMRKHIIRMMLYGICAELLATGLYVTLHGLTEQLSLTLGFLFTSLALFSLKFCHARTQQPSFFVWILTGISQGVAVIPGCSRLALTYTTARWLGYSGRHAMMLSFTLALPLFVSASAYGAYMMAHNPGLAYHITLYEIIALGAASCIAYGALLLTSYLMMRDRAYCFTWYTSLVLVMLAILH